MRMADFSSHRTDEDVELTQLGALKILLREALAATRDTRAAAADACAAAADARAAAISSAAAVSAIASLSASMDSLQQATAATSSTTVTATAVAVVEAVTAALGRPCGAALEPTESRYGEAPLSRRTTEGFNSVLGVRDRGGGDSVRVRSQAASLCGTAREHESLAGIPSAETAVMAMLNTFRSYCPANPADCSPSARGHPSAGFGGGQGSEEGAGALDGTDPRRGLGSLLDSAMHPVRLELERLRAIMIDVRGGLQVNSSRSTAPPPHMPLPHSPHIHATTLQQAAAAAVAISAASTPRDSTPRRQLRLVGKARNSGATPYSTRTGPRPPGEAGGGVEVNGIGLISWLMGPGRRLEPSDPGPALSSQIHPPPSLLPAT
jgi:hypothetical protein